MTRLPPPFTELGQEIWGPTVNENYTVPQADLIMAGRKKTVLRTIRIPEELDRVLQEEAARRRASVNGLVGGMLEKFAAWDRFTERFGMVSCSRAVFGGILASCDEEDLVRRAAELGGRLPREYVNLWFKEMSPESLQRYLALIAQYVDLYRGDLETRGSVLTFTAHHEFGEKWSRFLEAYFGEMARSFGLVPKIEHTTSQIILRVKLR